MIDIEKEVFTKVAQAVRAVFPDAYVVGEYVPSPPSFPCVFVEEKSNVAYRQTRDSLSNENHAELMYEISVYSNKQTGKKQECRKLIGIADEAMNRLGFTRTMLEPVQNLADPTIYRMTARFTAVVDGQHTIYRR